MTLEVLKDEQKYAREIKWRKTLPVKRDSTARNRRDERHGTFR